MIATGALIKDFVDNGWPGEPDELYYEGFYDDPDVTDIWSLDGEFALDLTTEYNTDDFGEICQSEGVPSKSWTFSHFFKKWFKSESRTHDVVLVAIRLPRNCYDNPKAVVLDKVSEMIKKNQLSDLWEVQE